MLFRTTMLASISIQHTQSHKGITDGKMRTAVLVCPVSFAEEHDGCRIK
jgi:hypothetical protein